MSAIRLQISVLAFVMSFASLTAAFAQNGVSIFGEDDREVISRTADKIGLSPREVEQAMLCTGKIECADGKWMSASAICAPSVRSADGKCVADRIATASHMFWDRKTKTLSKNLNGCFFKNYRGYKGSVIGSDLFMAIQSVLEYPESRKDRMVARLARPIPDCDPYEIDPGPPPSNRTELTVISHPHVDQVIVGGRFSGSEPIAYKCTTKHVWPDYERTHGIGSDCDFAAGGSGSLIAVREKGLLKVVGLLTHVYHIGLREATKEDDFMFKGEYSGDNFSLIHGVNGDFVQMANDPQRFADKLRISTDPKLSRLIASVSGGIHCQGGTSAVGQAIVVSPGQRVLASERFARYLKVASPSACEFKRLSDGKASKIDLSASLVTGTIVSLPLVGKQTAPSVPMTVSDKAPGSALSFAVTPGDTPKLRLCDAVPPRPCNLQIGEHFVLERKGEKIRLIGVSDGDQGYQSVDTLK